MSIEDRSKAEPYRVLMLTCQYMPDVFGGAEKQCQRLSNVLAARGHSVTVLTSTQRFGAAGRLVEGSLTVRRLYTGKPPDLLGRWIAFSAYWTMAAFVWFFKHRSEFDVIHCHQGKYGAFVATLLGAVFAKPVLVKIGNSEDDMDLLCLQRKFLVGSPMASFVRRSRPMFVAISSVISQNLKAFGCRDVVAIPNGIPEVHGVDLGAGPMGTSSSVRFFFHGRIEEIKRIDCLLAAFGLVRGSVPGAELHIVGDGRERARMEAYAVARGWGDAVTFHGEVKGILQFIEQFDVFVNASRSEGFSNSLLEALALNKLLVSTPVSGAREAIVEGDNGHVAESFEAEALADAMTRAARLFAEPSHRARVENTSRKLINERFAMDQVARQYEVLYQRLTGAQTA